MKRPILTAGGLLACALVLLAAPRGVPADPPPVPDREDLKRELKAARTASGTGARAAAVQHAGVKHLVLNLEFATPAARAAAGKLYAEPKSPVHVVMEFDRFATVLVPAPDRDALEAGYDKIESAAGLVWCESIGRVTPPPPPRPGEDVVPTGKSTAETIVRGGVKTLTGKGVIVAIIDSGVDFRHPDFVRDGAGGKKESRFVAIWDTHRKYVKGTGRPGPIAYPGGEPVGTVFTRDELTADLDTKALGDFDVDGHGTACAGIAAGNGQALELAKKSNNNADLQKMDYRGVAPGADLIAVRIGNAAGSALPNAWTLNAACAWIDGVAKEQQKPVVISGSFGAEVGGRDGCRIAERWLSERFPETTRGRLVFFAGGNEGDELLHGGCECEAGKESRLTWSLKAGKSGDINVYVDAADGKRLKKSDVVVEVGGTTRGKVVGTHINPLSGSVVVTVEVESGGSLTVRSAGNRALVADAYLLTDFLGGRFTGVSAKNAKQLLSPATAATAFAVGSYDFNHLVLRPEGLFETKDMQIGALSAYSNAGYVRGKTTVKPEFAAPGQWHLAPCPDPVPREIIDDKHLALTGRYQRFNGTSAATPYAAGVAALLLEQKPSLTAQQLRAALKAHLTRDKQTRETPNAEWGYGKLDKAAIERLLDAAARLP